MTGDGLAAVAMDDAPCTVELARKVLTKLNREALTDCDKLSARRPKRQKRAARFGGKRAVEHCNSPEEKGQAVEPK